MEVLMTGQGAQMFLEAIQEYQLEGTLPYFIRATATNATVTACPNYYIFILGACVQVYSILPVGWAFFKLFDWLLITVWFFATLAYSAVAANKINDYREGKGYHPCLILPFWASIMGITMHFLAALSHVLLYFFDKQKASNIFTFVWAPSMAMFCFMPSLLSTYYFNYFILKYDKTNANAKAKSSWYLYASCILAGLFTLAYAVYMMCITPIYKSKVPKYVNGGFYMMAVMYCIVAIQIVPMFWVVKFIRLQANASNRQEIHWSARVVTWWTGIVFILCCFSILNILWMIGYFGPVAQNLPPDASKLLKIQTPIMQALILHYGRNIINSVMSLMCIYFLSHSSRNIFPFIPDFVWLCSTKMRKEEYNRTDKESGGKNSGIRSSHLSSSKSGSRGDSSTDMEMHSVAKDAPRIKIIITNQTDHMREDETEEEEDEEEESSNNKDNNDNC